ncbi:tRNA(His) guanylyltransferase Thg1 family protein [Clostridium sp.]|uniref:tRNA(His) guanylyltransferase Thg1 family protein n=1 Tax=Clostridium sp. TaxID=1506 RepID=UPI00262C2669|nr:tRNA(His) guanylyltransferase Thg1 family protein [Clostridium sp.]
MSKDNLGDRMKGYENINRNFLTRRTPTIIRVDGKAFHTFSRGFKRPFDDILMQSMWDTAKYLCENIQGCKVAYTQSDEITLLLTDYEDINTDSWFGKNIQKMVSVSASMATLAFNKAFHDNIYSKIPNDDEIKLYEKYKNKINTALFDSRVFNIPKEEVNNCFVWRQQDATRNSIEMVGRAYFSHKELYKVNCNQIQDKLFLEKGINWNNLPTYQKRGVCIVKEQYQLDNEQKTMRSRWVVDKDIPIFSQDKNYIEKLI